MNEEKKLRPSWDEYFSHLANLVGERGTCDRGHCGALITKDRRIVSTGYAGSPVNTIHCDEAGHEMHTIIHHDGSKSEHCIRTTHAEQNAICQAARFGIALDGGTLYTKMAPCYACAKMMINAGIKRVVCLQDYHDSARSKEIFKEAGVEFVLLSDKVMEY
ncbi:MAG: cytidine/deoxycytidylate deaminase family protein [Candidatus Falkowbacteria bacterium]